MGRSHAGSSLHALPLFHCGGKQRKQIENFIFMHVDIENFKTCDTHIYMCVCVYVYAYILMRIFTGQLLNQLEF